MHPSSGISKCNACFPYSPEFQLLELPCHSVKQSLSHPTHSLQAISLNSRVARSNCAVGSALNYAMSGSPLLFWNCKRKGENGREGEPWAGTGRDVTHGNPSDGDKEDQAIAFLAFPFPSWLRFVATRIAIAISHKFTDGCWARSLKAAGVPMRGASETMIFSVFASHKSQRLVAAKKRFFSA